MSGKIWAFGCSQTYGHGLEDCIVRPVTPQEIEDASKWNVPFAPGKEPSKFAYPQLIGNALNKEVINLSRPGASNKYILRKIKMSQSEMSPDDIVLIGWTNKDRYIILKENIDCYWFGLHPTQIGRSKLADTYYKHIHDDNDADIVTMWYMNYAYLTLKVTGIKSIHCPITFDMCPSEGQSMPPLDPQEYDYRYFIKSQTNDSKFEVGLPLLSKTFMHPDIDKDFALDNIHQGPKTHRTFADLIITEFLTQ